MIRLTQKHAEFLVENKCKERNYSLIENFIYKNNTIKLYLRCNIDNHEWYSIYSNFISKNKGCPKCSKNAKISQKEAIDKINIICAKLNHSLVDEFIYKNIYSRINLKCDIHNILFNVSYDNYVRNNGACPKCKSEKGLKTMISNYGEIWKNIKPVFNIKSIKYLDIISEKLELPIQHALNGEEKKFHRFFVDGYIEKYGICIEWDENKHKYLREKDLIKEEYLKNNFNCITFRIDEKDFLKNIELGLNDIVRRIKEYINKIK